MPTKEQRFTGGTTTFANTPVRKWYGTDYEGTLLGDVNVPDERPLPQSPATPIGVVNENGDNDGRYAAMAKRPLPSDSLLKGIAGDSYMMSDEEKKRRMRAMRTAAMVGNLGNVMSAFANLYYTDKGAPSMQIPKPVIPDYMTFNDRVTQARRAAASEELQRERLNAESSYRKESLALRMKEEERRQATAKAQIEYTLNRADAIKSKADVDAAIATAKIALMNAGVEEKEANAEAKRIVANSQAYKNYAQGNAATTNASTASRRETRLASGTTKEERMDGLNKTTVTKPNSSVSQPERPASAHSVSASATSIKPASAKSKFSIHGKR